MPNPEYVDGQNDLTWEMRQTLVDWLLQVHLRYRTLAVTLHYESDHFFPVPLGFRNRSWHFPSPPSPEEIKDKLQSILDRTGAVGYRENDAEDVRDAVIEYQVGLGLLA